MSYVYRRPFEYAQRKQRFEFVPALLSSVEGVAAAAAFTTYAATVTSTAGANEKLARAFRSRTEGVYRKSWVYEQYNSRIILIYSAALETFAVTDTLAFTTYAATVQVVANPGATVATTPDTLAMTTYAAAVQGARAESPFIGAMFLTGHAATITRTAGLGPSRVGAVGSRSSGGYIPDSIRGATRGVRGRARITELVKRK